MFLQDLEKTTPGEEEPAEEEQETEEEEKEGEEQEGEEEDEFADEEVCGGICFVKFQLNKKFR
jgi:hypothetical protein